MRSRAVILGGIGGVVAAAIILGLAGNRDGDPDNGRRSGPLLSDCDGAIEQLVIHYVPSAKETVIPVYRDFLRQLPAEVAVWVVCSERADYEELAGLVGPAQCTRRPVIVSHPMTFWSRDRWLALAGEQAGQVTLLCPRGEEGAEVWPARAGDQRVAFDIAAAARGVSAERSPLHFDGGDFCADGQTAFVSPAVLRANIQRSVRTRAELMETLSAKLKRKVLLLEGAPDHHVGMYLMPAGAGAVVVGDPAEGKRLLEATAAGTPVASNPSQAALCPPEGPDFSPATRAQFDAVAARCAAAGYKVVRIPILPGKDGRTYLTYTNVIIDRRDGGRTAYMPTYRGADALNTAAERVWQSLGYRVCPVDCTTAYVHFGALHCLVNVLRRSA